MRDIKTIIFLMMLGFAGHSQTDTVQVKNQVVKTFQPDSVLMKDTLAKTSRPDSVLVKPDSVQVKKETVEISKPDTVVVKEKTAQTDSVVTKKVTMKTSQTFTVPAKSEPVRMYLSERDSLMVRNASGRTLKRLGKNALLQNDPASAIVFFEAYLRNNRNDAVAMYLLGHAYLKERDYDNAQRMFLRAYKTDKEKAPEALYYHAQMQKSNGLYDSAKVNFEKFKKEYKGNEKSLKKIAAREVILCDSVQKLIVSEHKIVILHLDSTINKINTEGAPVAFNDSTLVFTSLRTDKRVFVSEEDTGDLSKRKLYFAKRENDTWQFKGEYSDVLNDANTNTGNACFSPDRKRIYFTRCKPNFNEVMTCALYVSEKNGDDWSEPVKLPKTINNPKYTSTMPSITVEPLKGNEVIYYVSNNKEGKGGMDIWYTIYDKKNKTYKSPRNAGTKINSSGDEISPYFDNETRTLYYSSDGIGGLGGFDIFKATGDGKKWLAVENIGQPINTGADDIFYTISTNREEGFFVSNRKGGNSIKSNTCCDDIYYYKHSEYVRIFVSGTITEIKDPVVFVANATIEVYLKDKKTHEKILVKTVTTDSLGRYKTSLEADKDYFLIVKKSDFLGTSGDVDTRGIVQSKTLTKDLSISKKPKDPIRIPNIQYAFDKSDMMESSKAAIDSTVFRLMEANPDLIIEIQSHTDNKGSDVYNEKLSQKRAESVVKYLQSKGIAPERLKAKGYGESKPIAPNENTDGSDNPDGRAQNRRTDFKIIGVLDTELINAAGEGAD